MLVSEAQVPWLLLHFIPNRLPSYTWSKGPTTMKGEEEKGGILLPLGYILVDGLITFVPNPLARRKSCGHA